MKSNEKMEKISVLGLGYVGLPTAIILADAGYKVHGFDINAKIIDSINTRNFSYEEAKVEELLIKVLDLEKFFVSDKLEKSDIYIICVPTPKKEYKSDLSFLYDTIDRISKVIENNSLVIIESTIPIGTTRKSKDLLTSKRNDLDKSKIFFAHCPERVLPGNAISEIINNHRVIGGLDINSSEKAFSIPLISSCFAVS